MGQSNMLGEGKIHGGTNGSLDYAVRTEHKVSGTAQVDAISSLIPIMMRFLVPLSSECRWELGCPQERAQRLHDAERQCLWQGAAE